jgi:hypothetical protein
MAGFEGDPRPPGRGEPVIVGVVSRLVHQKGLELLVEVIPGLVEEGFRFAVVGTGEPDLEDAFLALGRDLPGRVWAALDPGQRVASKIYGGSDLFCVPSRYEPCGLTQQYALLYGSIPVVRRTGGLADTVDESVGFLFDEMDPEALARALRRAAGAVRHHETRVALQVAGMDRGLSWDDVAALIRRQVYLDGPARATAPLRARDVLSPGRRGRGAAAERESLPEAEPRAASSGDGRSPEPATKPRSDETLAPPAMPRPGETRSAAPGGIKPSARRSGPSRSASRPGAPAIRTI